MTENQYRLCIEIFRRLDKAGLLKHIVLIGSWCIPFYQKYFSDIRYLQPLKTRDIDFLVPEPRKLSIKIDIPELLKDLGFIIGFKGHEGHLKLEHPDLIVEFLVPEKGRGTNNPVPIPQLGINAQALRYLNYLTETTITLDVEGMQIKMPHPINFALQKLIVCQFRKDPEKAAKDKTTALRILKVVIEKGEKELILKAIASVPEKWKKKILINLVDTGVSKEIFLTPPN